MSGSAVCPTATRRRYVSCPVVMAPPAAQHQRQHAGAPHSFVICSCHIFPLPPSGQHPHDVLRMPAHGYSPSVLETVAVVLKNLWVRFLAAVEDRLDLPRPREDLRVLESYPVPDVIGPICKRSPEDISFGDAVRALEGPSPSCRASAAPPTSGAPTAPTRRVAASGWPCARSVSRPHASSTT